MWHCATGEFFWHAYAYAYAYADDGGVTSILISLYRLNTKFNITISEIFIL